MEATSLFLLAFERATWLTRRAEDSESAEYRAAEAVLNSASLPPDQDSLAAECARLRTWALPLVPTSIPTQNSALLCFLLHQTHRCRHGRLRSPDRRARSRSGLCRRRAKVSCVGSLEATFRPPEYCWASRRSAETYSYRVIDARVLLAAPQRGPPSRDGKIVLMSYIFTASFVAPAANPTSASSNYVGKSNSTLQNGPTVPGKAFDRIIQIWLENTDYETAASSPVFQNLTKQGLLLSGYHGNTHPSEPNYAVAGMGDFFGMHDDAFYAFPKNTSSVADLLEAKNISWASYQVCGTSREATVHILRRRG